MLPVPLMALGPKQWVQIGGAVLAVLAVSALIVLVLHWKNQAELVPALKAEIVAAEARLTEVKEDVAKSNAASAGYQAELERLRNARTVVPSRPVRVCRDAPAVPASRPAESGPDESPTDGGVLPEAPGPDIGPELYGAADLADELSAQIRGLHEYIREVCHAKEDGT